MRVIAGSAKGRKLKSVPGESTRPILDRIKENLFNILGSQVRESRWLDLFAGTGSVGIEALSRGAAYCLFVDNSRAAIRTIRENLEHTRLADRGEVLRENAYRFLQKEPDEEDAFDVVYIAPPQYKDMWLKALKLIDAQPGWLIPNGLVIVQIDPKEYEEVQLRRFYLYDQRSYGNTLLCFYERDDD
jgi:16S rRNA (guanine966-N2)-methyltransferase